MFHLYLCLVDADKGPKPCRSKRAGVKHIFHLRDE